MPFGWSARVRLAAVVAWAIAAAITGCVHTPKACDAGTVSARLECRTGHGLGVAPRCGPAVMPCGASLADGLTEEEAVLIALWNNAQFQELLTDLGVARADLIQAGLLPNPEVVYFFPATDKPYKYAVDLPIEALWLRPIRVAAAGRESARACDRLVQAGLDLIRDVRQAYADVLLAKGRLRVANDAVQIRGRIAEIAAARLRAGDIAPQEAATARVDSLVAQQDVTRVGYEVALAEERLRNLLGLGDERPPLDLDGSPIVPRTTFDVECLTAEATTGRPDAAAAAQAADAASERLRLARVAWVRFLGILDATSGRNTGHEFSPAFRVTVPVFNHNQGGIARAEADLDRAERAQRTVHNQIILEVHQAYERYSQAKAELEVLDRDVRPEVEASIRRAQNAYQEGNAAYIIVLEATRQLLDSRVREYQLHADLRRAWADLERSVGRHLDR
jgi:cobalt-zinc-cadmium efflux system outer membrane protein